MCVYVGVFACACACARVWSKRTHVCYNIHVICFFLSRKAARTVRSQIKFPSWIYWKVRLLYNINIYIHALCSLILFRM